MRPSRIHRLGMSAFACVALAVAIAPAAAAAPVPEGQLKAALLTAKQASGLMGGAKTTTPIPAGCMVAQWTPPGTVADPSQQFTQCYQVYGVSKPPGYRVDQVAVRSFSTPELNAANLAGVVNDTVVVDGQRKVLSQTPTQVVLFDPRTKRQPAAARVIVVSGTAQVAAVCTEANEATKAKLVACARKAAALQLAQAPQ